MSAYDQVQATYFDWKIVDFSRRCKYIDDIISSPSFTAHQTRWVLIVVLDICRNGDKSITLYAKSLSNREIKVSFEISLLNHCGQIFHEASSPEVLFSYPTYGWGWNKFYSRELIINNPCVPLAHDELIVRCKLGLNTVSETSIRDHLVSNMESLFLNTQFSDLTIRVGRHKLYAHKNILAARSKVFSAMFSCNMIENEENNLKITDISYDVMKELLRFIYCGKVLDIKTMVTSLLIAADKYDIITLKTLCEQTIWRSMDISKACDMLHLADLYDCKTLRCSTFSFVLKNITNITETDGFKALKFTNPKLLEELICKMNVKRF